MATINLKDVTQYVEDNIGVFHSKRIDRIKKIKLNQILRRKNPYLFKAKNSLTAEQIIRSLLDAHISSNEETVFGDWLEGLAIFINNKLYNGSKSSAKGIDLEFDKDGTRYIVNIKSGPNWGNASQITKMKTDFLSASRTLRTSNSKLKIVAVNGCCYGKDKNPDKGDYFKYCGQDFWEFISDSKDLYTDIIQPLGHKSKEKNQEFDESYSIVINKFTRQFSIDYCNNNGTINWAKLVKFNSSNEI